jgi:hypothetical protein
VPQEIEHKYLVRLKDWKPTIAGVLYRQGYLSSVEERVVRVRRTPTPSWAAQWVLPVRNLAAPAVHQGDSLPAGESISGRIAPRGQRAGRCRPGMLLPDRRSPRPLEF